jgi:hypothetical protein
VDFINDTFTPHPNHLPSVTAYTQILESVKGRYTGPPTPPSLGGNNPKFCISPPKLGGLGGRMQGVQKESNWYTVG